MRTLFRTSCMAVLALVFATPGLAQYGSSNGGGPVGTISSELASASAAAALAYKEGLRSVRRGQGYDAQALKASTPEKADKAHERAQSAYRESISALVRAITVQPNLSKAWYYLGFADSQLGNYEEALTAYTKVLGLNPSDQDAREGRAEVYLSLNQIDEAKSAYTDLSRDSKSLANDLLSTMRRWIESRRQDAQGVDPADIEAFAKWMDARAASTG